MGQTKQQSKHLCVSLTGWAEQATLLAPPTVCSTSSFISNTHVDFYTIHVAVYNIKAPIPEMSKKSEILLNLFYNIFRFLGGTAAWLIILIM